MAKVTPTDRPTSVRNRRVIEHFVALFVLSLCPFDISADVGSFVIRLSQISSFFSISSPELDRRRKRNFFREVEEIQAPVNCLRESGTGAEDFTGSPESKSRNTTESCRSKLVLYYYLSLLVIFRYTRDEMQYLSWVIFQPHLCQLKHIFKIS